jgi:Domain of unknown function (DUF5602)
MLTKTVSTIIVISLAAAALACPFCKVKTYGRFPGQVELVGNGTAYTWLDVDKEGKPVAIGVSLSEAALTGLTEEVDKLGMGPEWRLKLPKEASMFPIDHLAIGWNPKGHEPEGIYNVAHFDFHFYLIDVATRQGILPEPETMKKCETPLGTQTPEGYVMGPGTAVPWMGAHWINPKSSEFNGKPFTSTFLYGGYDGKLAFIEPMITKAFIESKTEATFDIPAPKTSWKPGLFPTKYTVRYDSVRKEYQVFMHGFVQVGS